jgi:hypothetical protein
MLRIAGLAWLATGPVVGYFVHDFMDFRGKHTELAKEVVAETNTAAEELGPMLRKFTGFARGEGSPKREDRNELANAVQKALAKADVASKHLPSLEVQFKAYADALVELQRTADQMTGPQDAKPLGLAMARFFKAKDDFDKAATDVQRSYVRSFIARI